MGIYHTTESSHHFEEILKYKEINFDITIFLTNIGNWIVGTLVGTSFLREIEKTRIGNKFRRKIAQFTYKYIYKRFLKCL